VLDQISSWGWTPGLRPGSGVPVVRMDRFRDRFLAAYGSTTAATAPSGQQVADR
jgi:hypothetical protein